MEAFGRKWRRVWVEDVGQYESGAHVEDYHAAWERLFGERCPSTESCADHRDLGTSDAFLFGDRLLITSIYGDRIYVPVEAPSDTMTITPATTWVAPGPLPFLDHRPVSGYAPPSDPYTAMVREFHNRMGLVTRDAPSLGTPAEREERVRLMLEELLEVARALGVKVVDSNHFELENVADLTVSGTGLEPDIASVLHELADLQVTVSGTAVQFGLPLLAATREVHSANMRKTPQGPGRKPTKPEGWGPADVSGVLVENVTHSADPSQPTSVALPESGCSCGDSTCPGCYFDGWAGGGP